MAACGDRATVCGQSRTTGACREDGQVIMGLSQNGDIPEKAHAERSMRPSVSLNKWTGDGKHLLNAEK